MFFKPQDGELQNLSFVWSFTRRTLSATNACRIRRDSDDAETDLILESALNDTCDINSSVTAGGTVSSWAGTDTIFMVTDYDQTGNGHDFTQSDKTKQASIATGGVWTGYKNYSSGDIYKTSTQVTDQEGSVYIKAGRPNLSTRYFLSQALASGTNDNKVLSLATSFGTGNKVRILDFTPTIKVIEGNNAIAAISIMTYRCGSVNLHTLRLDGTNETKTATSPETDNWFGDYVDTGFTLQKGQLHWNGGAPIGTIYHEYEILGFDVEHDDTESATIEALM